MCASREDGNIVKLRPAGRRRCAEAWHRKLALHVSAHLPDDPGDAEIVLRECLRIQALYLPKGF
jgi:hypothetical protein